MNMKQPEKKVDFMQCSYTHHSIQKCQQKKETSYRLTQEIKKVEKNIQLFKHTITSQAPSSRYSIETQ